MQRPKSQGPWSREASSTTCVILSDFKLWSWNTVAAGQGMDSCRSRTCFALFELGNIQASRWRKRQIPPAQSLFSRYVISAGLSVSSAFDAEPQRTMKPPYCEWRKSSWLAILRTITYCLNYHGASMTYRISYPLLDLIIGPALISDFLCQSTVQVRFGRLLLPASRHPSYVACSGLSPKQRWNRAC